MKANEGTEFMQCIPNTTDYDITSWWWWDKLREGDGYNWVAGKDALTWFGGPALDQQKRCKLQQNAKECLSVQIDLGWDKPNYWSSSCVQNYHRWRGRRFRFCPVLSIGQKFQKQP